MVVARGAAVTIGGPLVFDAWCALAPRAAWRRWPDRLRRRGLRRAAWAVTVGGLAAPWMYAGLVRPWLQHWGSTEAERLRRLPSDDPERAPLSVTTRAVTVDAPAEAVWPWLVQLGADRGGFYSYDWLENLAGCRLRSADRVHDEWQHLQAGDRISLGPEMSVPVAEVRPGRALVIEGWGSYVLEPIDGERCRLIARSHTERDLTALGYLLLIELPHAIMERKMLLGIKERAERPAFVPLWRPKDEARVEHRGHPRRVRDQVPTG